MRDEGESAHEPDTMRQRSIVDNRGRREKLASQCGQRPARQRRRKEGRFEAEFFSRTIFQQLTDR